MATSESHRGRLYDAKETMNIILDSLSDAESDDLGEPIYPGSDKEFPDIDDNNNR